MLVLLAAFGFSPSLTQAQTSADFSTGSMIVGYDNRTCGGSIEGSLRYNGGALPLGHWKLDETSGNSITDYGSGGNNGQWYDGTDNAITGESVSGQVDTALDFEADDSTEVRVTADDSINNLTTMSVCAWINPETIADSYPSIITKINPISDFGWGLYLNSGAGDIEFQTRMMGYKSVSTPDITTGSWQHVCATWDGTDGHSGIKLYIDGNHETSVSTGDWSGSTFDDSSYNITIGDTGVEDNFDGMMDDVCLFNEVLDDTAIANIYNYGCQNAGGGGGGGGTQTVILTTGTSWTVPADWNNSNNTIHVIGGGGGGRRNAGSDLNGGGGGGAYSSITNLSLTPSSSISYVIGAGGAQNNNGGDSYFNGAACGSSSACAKGGQAGQTNSTAAGGAASSGVGDTKYDGGDGGSSNDWGGGGGGGAAGPNGAGGDGGNTAWNGGGGGGGNGGGDDATSVCGSCDDGTDGGDNYLATGGGAAGINESPGSDGTDGGGGGGGGDNAVGDGDNHGGDGGDGIEWITAGSGGGGGGAANYAGGGDGGLYGAGGGGAGDDTSSAAGAGAQGVIVIQYTPAGGDLEICNGSDWVNLGSNSCADPTAGMTADQTETDGWTGTSLEPATSSATFHMNVTFTGSPSGTILESGATGQGMAVWADSSNLYFGVGDGGDSSTSTDAVVLSYPMTNLLSNTVDLVFAVDPAAGTAAIYVDNCKVAAGATTGGGALASNEWAGTDGAGYGIDNSSIRTGADAGNFNGTLGTMTFFSGELPADF